MNYEEPDQKEKGDLISETNHGWLNFIWKEFIYGGHLQSIGTSSIVMVSSMLLGIQITWDCLFISYLMFYPLYLYNRFKEIEIDYLTNPERTDHLKAYLNIMPTILLLAVLALALALVYFSNSLTSIFALFLVILGIMYTIIFKTITRRIALFKDFYVAAFFAPMVFFPIFYYNHEPTLSAFIFAGFTYLKALTMQILLDVKDIETDLKQGLLTFPIVLGKEKTLRILKIANVVIIFAIIAISYCFNIFPKAIMALLLVIPFNFYCIKQAQKNNYFGYILASGEFILWLLLIVIAKNIII